MPAGAVQDDEDVNVVIVGELTVMLKLLVTVFNLSETEATNEYVVFDTGAGVIPDITPEEESVIFGGRDPLTMAYVLVSFSGSVEDRLSENVSLVPSVIVAREPDAVVHTGERLAIDVIENDLGILFRPSEAVIVNEYVVFETISGRSPDINPDEEFKVTPEGRDPDVKE